MTTATLAASAPADDRLMDRKEAAAYIRKSPATLAAWACHGSYDLPFIRVGRNVRYRKSDLDAFLDRHTGTCNGDFPQPEGDHQNSEESEQ